MFDYSAPRDRQGFRSAVRVRALWRNITLNEDVLRRNYFRSSTPEYPRCSALGVESDIMLETGLAAAITFYCPPRIVYDGSLRSECQEVNSPAPIPIYRIIVPGNLTTTNQESRSIYLADWPLTVPDLLITVNWTAIGMTADPLTDAAFTSVNVMVALTNQTLDAIRDTTAIPMHPGSRLLGSLTRSFRQRFGDTQRAALGIPDVCIFPFAINACQPLFPVLQHENFLDQSSHKPNSRHIASSPRWQRRWDVAIVLATRKVGLGRSTRRCREVCLGRACRRGWSMDNHRSYFCFHFWK